MNKSIPKPINSVEQSRNILKFTISYKYGDTPVKAVYNRDTQTVHVHTPILKQLYTRYWEEALTQHDQNDVTEFLRQETGLVFTPITYCRLRKNGNHVLGIEIEPKDGLGVQDLYGIPQIMLVDPVNTAGSFPPINPPRNRNNNE